MADVNNKVANVESRLGEKLNSIENELRLRVEALEGRRSNPPTNDTDRSSEDSLHSTITPANAGTPPTHNTIPVFDGKTPWEDYMTLFETAASIHRWSNDNSKRTFKAKGGADD